MKKEINENKMDFIVCYNDALYMRECQRYIENLHVPENMSIEVLGISDADSEYS